MTEQAHDAYAAIRIRNCRRFLLGNVFSTVGAQMLYLALSWEVYERTNSPTALGIVGLFQVLPIMVFSLPAGQLIDRSDRRLVVLVDQILFGLSASLFAVVSLAHTAIPQVAVLGNTNALLGWIAGAMGETQQHYTDAYIPVMLGLLLINGVIRAVNQPAKQALLPQLVSMSLFTNAVTWHSSMVEVSTMVGPALAGVMLSGPAGTGWAFPAVYGIAAILQFVSVLFFAGTRPVAPERVRQPMSLQSLGGGLTFVWHSKIVLATITLDLLSVLLGGSVALLPMFARDVLHSGPRGLGLLRAAPSIGACAMALCLAHRPAMRRTGAWMLGAAAIFGAATIGFGLSDRFELSLVMLLVIGACDNVSTIGRQSLVQMLTPDAMRGRVSAVKAVFSSTSDGLGALESGLAAAALGPRLAVVLGGIGTLLVGAVCGLIWPELRKFRADPPQATESGGESHTLPGRQRDASTDGTRIDQPPRLLSYLEKRKRAARGAWFVRGKVIFAASLLLFVGKSFIAPDDVLFNSPVVDLRIVSNGGTLTVEAWRFAGNAKVWGIHRAPAVDQQRVFHATRLNLGFHWEREIMGDGLGIYCAGSVPDWLVLLPVAWMGWRWRRRSRGAAMAPG